MKGIKKCIDFEPLTALVLNTSVENVIMYGAAGRAVYENHAGGGDRIYIFERMSKNGQKYYRKNTQCCFG